MGTKTQKLSNVVDQIVEWQAVFTGDGSTGLTAVAGRGYFIDTTSGAVTVTLPASPKIGDIVQLKDYARTWGTNAVTIASVLTDGNSTTNSFSTNGQTVTLVYMDGTKGWSLINEDTTTGLNAAYITATGGTVTESGDYKIHTFTGDGCFVVSCGGNPLGSDTVDYLVVAGGGAGGESLGGGGAGGYRESSGAASGCYTASPLGACVSALPVSATTYPVTVGGGGAPQPGTTNGGDGSNSVFSTITSTGGGGGAKSGAPRAGSTGGSGGGAGGTDNGSGTGGAGNTPPVSPPQGNDGGDANSTPASQFTSGGGGGAGAAGANGTNPTDGANGGAGVTSSINGTPTARAGGGGGGGYQFGGGGSGGTGGTGGGGNGGYSGGQSTTGTANTGGGGGGSGIAPNGVGNPIANTGGGKGIVIIRYKFQN